MSQQSNQIAQYKNAAKLLNKKCQALEAQLNGMLLYDTHHEPRVKIEL